MSHSGWPKPHSSGPWSSLSQQDIRKLANTLARLLDVAWTIPGTRVSIGLDPLIGLIPGLGDALSNAIGSLLLVLATKAGVPRIVIVRMALNVCLNMAIGAIPVLGDAFSIWFTSNLRNARLLDRHCQPGQRSLHLTDWIYVVTILGLLVVLMAGLLWGLGWALFTFLEWLNPKDP